jgi:hypothetical protein
MICESPKGSFGWEFLEGRGGEGILLVNFVWFIFLRRGGEGRGGEEREYKTIFASP